MKEEEKRSMFFITYEKGTIDKIVDKLLKQGFSEIGERIMIERETVDLYVATVSYSDKDKAIRYLEESGITYEIVPRADLPEKDIDDMY